VSAIEDFLSDYARGRAGAQAALASSAREGSGSA
jgi:hypothetical protein